MGSRLQDVIMRDTRANQPLATAVSAGTLYYVTDEEVTERSSGSAWQDVSDAGTVPTAITQLTGDVTAGPGPGSVVATIANNAVVTAKILDKNVTYAKIQDVTNARLLGNFTGGAAAPAEYSLGEGLEHSAGAIRTKVDIRTEQIGITVDGGGSVVTIGDKGFKSFPVAGTIIAWRLMADAAGDVDFDVTLDDFASFPPTTSILTPDLSGVQTNEATGLSIAVVAGDVFGFEVTGTPLTITRVTLEITIVVTG